jgi:hypothetical protein
VMVMRVGGFPRQRRLTRRDVIRRFLPELVAQHAGTPWVQGAGDPGRRPRAGSARRR